MGLCGLDAQCKAHFPAGLSSALRGLIEKFDTDKNSTCATLVNRDEPDLPPSYMLRFMLGTLMGDASTRTLIPPAIYRLSRCNAKDVEVMTQLFKSVQTASTSANEDTHFSFLLYYLIVYSEYWETPAPSRAEMESRMNGSTIVTRATFRQALPLYCAVSKEKSVACDEFNFGNYDAGALSYQRDQYWNKPATLPNDASVLLLSEYLVEALGTSKKELVALDYVDHDVVYSSLLGSGKDPVLTCGLQLLVSYISNNGDLERLNRTCVNEMPAFNLTVPTYELHNLLSTDDGYDGVFKPELSSS
ncbi:hypothetical protein PHYSODRAFT_254169 [Phytophthora sojae]|uniref:Uncharacterized protein n=1 Tax=Phytophthora sojae (strain P6497) TaxID=1094619 RepID=G5A8P5_PHYSP|nr:hypothetical protein PHYSODRAFT_254169 [Phytophthora sojae]EGZ08271.1 hypothetical protein PHYSODRAFT_254169 [Phytophthora sojae]|eukprot:XP_009536443.1 hypothetical protein PHYSODRAFT_254169 [Phytophthora sojae]